MRRAPHGARGLKYAHGGGGQHPAGSRPAWGAWIEMLTRGADIDDTLVAPRMGRVD